MGAIGRQSRLVYFTLLREFCKRIALRRWWRCFLLSADFSGLLMANVWGFGVSLTGFVSRMIFSSG
jgi:hypothetical protein